MIRPALGSIFLVFIIFSTVIRLPLLSNDARPETLSQDSLRSMILKQPDFRAELEYEKENGLQTVDQVSTIMKRGDMYRFEVLEQNSIDGALFLLAYPGKGIRIFSPKDQVWFDEFDLDKAAFTTLAGVDIYYLTKIVQHKESKFEYVSTEDVNGYACLKIRIGNEFLLNSQVVRFEQLYLMSGPLYFYLSPKLNNLTIAADGTDVESKEEGRFYSLKNISLDKSRIPKELFEVPSNFRKLKNDN